MNKLNKKMVTEGVEPSTVALLAQRSNQLSYATYLLLYFFYLTNFIRRIFLVVDLLLKFNNSSSWKRIANQIQIK